ncbi:MAG: PDZ domain-containing protein [bacterium]|nr:PDZ domain-containing protein [Candidatus Kapabacteria bacterium]
MSNRKAFSTPLIALNVFVFLIAMAGAYQVHEKAGVLIDLASVNGRIAVGRINDGAPAALRQQARTGDSIASIDGFAVDNATALETILDAHVVGDVVTFGIQRDGSEFDVSVQLVRVYSTLYVSLILFVGLLFFALGLLVLRKRPDDEASLIFHLAMDCTAIMIMATAGRYSVEPEGLGHIVRVAYVFAYAFMTVLFFHFTLIFPSPKWENVRRNMRWGYALATLVAITTSVTFILASYVSAEAWTHTFSRAFEFTQVFFATMGIVSVASFVHSYRSAVEETERLKLRWVLTGVSVGFLTFIALSLIPTAVLRIPPLIGEEWIILMIAVAPVTFAIAIVRHRVMDIDLILSRSTVYMVVLGTLVGVYIALVTLFGQFVHGFGWSDKIGPTIATLVIALLFEPAFQRVQRFVDRRFFRMRYNLRQAHRTLAEELNTCLETTKLAARTTQILDGILAPERIALTTVRASDNVVSILASSALMPTDRQPDAHNNYDWIEPGEMYATERWIEPGVDHSTRADAMLDRLGVCCAIAAPMNGADMAILLVGPKKSGTRYTLEDLDVLRAAITHTSTGLERIMLQTSIMRREAEAEQLRELNRMKSYFVSSVTHELKTPLTSIRMFAEMLQGDRAVEHERVTRYAKIIEAESQRLARLIDNVLDFSKLERGTKEYRFAEIELTDVVDGVIGSLEHQITSSGFALRRDDESGPIVLNADADAVTGALVNLISNAIKYSQADREINVCTFRRKSFAGVSVADRGIGLSADDRAHIFDPFYRADAGKNMGAAGTGLGLALVRNVIEAHGGSIEVESEPGQGSTFTLLFPINDDENNPADRG